DHLGKRAERGEQLLCQRFHVALRYGAKQDELEHFVIADRLAAGREKPLPQALAVAVVMRRLVGGGRRWRRFVATGHGHLGRHPRCVPDRAGTARKDARSIRFCNGSKRRCYARGAAEGRGRSSPCGESVKISTPASVTATVCSNWAESERSRVTAVQPSESTFPCGRPRLIIASPPHHIPGRRPTP